MSNKQPFKKPFRLEDNEKYTRWGTNWPDTKKSPAFSVGLYEGNPRLKIFLNNGSKNPNQTVATDPFLFKQFITLLKQVASEKPPYQPGVRWTHRFKNSRDNFGRPMDKPAEVSRLMIGRNADLAVYIAVQLKGVKEIPELVFGQNFWGELADGSGELLSAAACSSIDALCTAEVWGEVTTLSAATQLAPTKKWRDRQERAGGNDDDFDSAYGGTKGSSATGDISDDDFVSGGF